MALSERGSGRPGDRSPGDRSPGDRSPGGDDTGPAGPRRRPGPTSSVSPPLTPDPSPLMPPAENATVPSPVPPEGGRAGRRQHHRHGVAGGGAGHGREDLVYLSGRIPRGLRDELHVRAIGEGRPVVDLMRDAIRGYLDRTSPTPDP